MQFSHKTRLFILVIALLLWATVFTSASPQEEPDREVSVYSHRHYEVDQRLFEIFTEETGIAVNVVNAGADELIQRLLAEGERTPADILITVDAGRLYRAKEAGLLQAISSAHLEARIPAHLRDPEGFWFGLTKRARVIVADKDRVAAGEILNYEDLADPEWSNRVVVRSSSNIYNQSLFASIVAAHGEDRAREWAEDFVGNLARDPKGNDRDQMKAIAAGIADIALVNTYYVGLMQSSDAPEERAVAENLRIVFPNSAGRGTHVNVSGAGITAYAPNPDNAIELLQFLVSDRAQAEYSAANFEYPVVEGVEPNELVAAWGLFEEDKLSLVRLGELNRVAVTIMDEVGWK